MSSSVVYSLLVYLATISTYINAAPTPLPSQLPFSDHWWRGGDDEFAAAVMSNDTLVLFGSTWDGHCKSFIAKTWPLLPLRLHPTRPSLQFILYDCKGFGPTQPRLCTELMGDRMRYYSLVYFSPSQLASNGSMRLWSYDFSSDLKAVVAFLSDVEQAGKRWSEANELQATEWLSMARQHSTVAMDKRAVYLEL